jgi:SAM-dependent methyltransferase
MLRISGAKLPYSAVQAVRFVLGRRVRSRRSLHPFVTNKCGLEIGGSNRLFTDGDILPFYRRVARLDNCVYASTTLWASMSERPAYCYHPRKPEGTNFILEATSLEGIADARYDFVLSSHTLEHTANPMKALKEWLRVIRPGGAIILVLPYYKATFDHRRTPTPLEHMLDNFRRNTTEEDLTHLEEVLQLHDLSRNGRKMTPAEFRDQCRDNFANRGMHHHVFDEHNARELLEAAGLAVPVVELAAPHRLHLILLGRK